MHDLCQQLATTNKLIDVNIAAGIALERLAKHRRRRRILMPIYAFMVLALVGLVVDGLIPGDNFGPTVSFY